MAEDVEMSCLFRSIGDLLDIPHQQVREDVVDFMEHNSDSTLNGLKLSDWIKHASEENTDTLEEYMQWMRSESAWGSCLEIACASMLYEVCIRVYIERTRRWITVGTRDLPVIELRYVNDNHYTPY